MADRAAYYWDSCCFLSLIEGKSRWPNRVPMLELILDRCERDLCDIYTSEATITEVAYAKYEQDKKALDPAAEKKIDALYVPVKMIEVSRFIARDARDFIRKIISHPKAKENPTGLSLKAMDAIHLASAVRRGLKELHTYDKKLHRFDGMLGVKIIRPTVPDLPLELASLPDKD
ncbi:MAG TPA: type II toxin-antitoxin system VapC family toxin [Phycisphaerae bacterium]|nr:type II toxin-antitoxin system VapC family toxin [Phycisphaerae bacterium]